MELVSALGYLVVQGSQRDWDCYATEILGMQRGDALDGGGVARYRMDDRTYRLAVHEGEPGVVSVGFEVKSSETLDRLMHVLMANGYSAVEDSDLAAERNVRRLVKSVDPTGIQVEFFVGAEITPSPFVSPMGVKFVAGELGMGHVFLLAPDADVMFDYYVHTLGFKVSDTIDFDLTEGVFLHCNERHHSLAFAAIPDISSGIGHLMLEVDTLDGVGRALDRAQDRDLISATIGKHTNDLMTSFYMTTPSGFEIEYGYEGRLVRDDDWVVGRHLAASSWGHRRS